MVTFAFNPITTVMLIIFRPPKKEVPHVPLSSSCNNWLWCVSPNFLLFLGRKIFFSPKKKKKFNGGTAAALMDSATRPINSSRCARSNVRLPPLTVFPAEFHSIYVSPFFSPKNRKVLDPHPPPPNPSFRRLEFDWLNTPLEWRTNSISVRPSFFYFDRRTLLTVSLSLWDAL